MLLQSKEMSESINNRMLDQQGIHHFKTSFDNKTITLLLQLRELRNSLREKGVVIKDGVVCRFGTSTFDGDVDEMLERYEVLDKILKECCAKVGHPNCQFTQTPKIKYESFFKFDRNGNMELPPRTERRPIRTYIGQPWVEKCEICGTETQYEIRPMIPIAKRKTLLTIYGSKVRNTIKNEL